MAANGLTSVTAVDTAFSSILQQATDDTAKIDFLRNSPDACKSLFSKVGTDWFTFCLSLGVEHRTLEVIDREQLHRHGIEGCLQSALEIYFEQPNANMDKIRKAFRQINQLTGLNAFNEQIETQMRIAQLVNATQAQVTSGTPPPTNWQDKCAALEAKLKTELEHSFNLESKLKTISQARSDAQSQNNRLAASQKESAIKNQQLEKEVKFLRCQVTDLQKQLARYEMEQKQPKRSQTTSASTPARHPVGSTSGYASILALTPLSQVSSSAIMESLKRVEKDWRAIGIHLGLEDYQLNRVEVDLRQHGLSTICFKMVTSAMDNFVNITAMDLVEAVEKATSRSEAKHVEAHIYSHI